MGRNRVNRVVGAAMIAAAALLAPIFAGTANANIVYGDFGGATVDYFNVVEDSQGLYGVPTVTGDTLTFNPLDFEVLSSGAVPPQLVDGTVNFVLDAKPGHSITGLSINEGGAYNLLGTGTDATRVTVGAAVIINVLEVDGVALPGGLLLADQLTFADFNLADDGPAFATTWTGGGLIDLQTLASEAGINGDLTRISVSINNVLVAYSEAASTSFIDKKAVNATVITIPEPASLALAGLGVLTVFRRRRAA